MLLLFVLRPAMAAAQAVSGITGSLSTPREIQFAVRYDF